MDSEPKRNPETPPPSNQRSSTYVDRLVQGTMLRRVIIHWVAYIAVTFIVGLAFTWMLDPFYSQRQVLIRFLTVHGPSLIVALLLIPAFASDTIRLTHRIAGPMVQIRRELHSLAEGRRAKRVAFRPDDFWHEIGDEFNFFSDYVEPKIDPSGAAPDRESATLAT